jgi:hypothetical protein
LRFFAVRTRCGEARCRTPPLVVSQGPFAPHGRGRSTVRSQFQQRLSIVPARTVRRIRRAVTHRRPVHQAPPLRSFADPGSVMHRRFDLGRCSATTRDHRGLAGRVVLPSCPSGGAPGVLISTLRRFAPTHGWRIISDRAGPTCLFVQPSRPD